MPASDSAAAPPPPIASVELIVGLEVHVELATASKMFSRAPSPAYTLAGDDRAPNTLVDATVFGLPGALPVMNRAAVEMSIRVGLSLSCEIARRSRWDRKSYFYPDLPKGYQLSQYDQPLCGEGFMDLPPADEQGFPTVPESIGPGGHPASRVRVLRAHLEEDAGKLLHEAPGGRAIAHSLVDENRAGTPLLEIVTHPDFRSAAQVVLFCRMLHDLCRGLGVTHGMLERGQMRFEPNINCRLTLENGTTVATPIVEIKNLNSFRSVKAAIEHELAEQPGRWQQDGRVMGPGTKTTRGWDDTRGVTFIQRDKEDAHDYRYFPDPDLPPVHVDEAWIERLRATLRPTPQSRWTRYTGEYALAPREATALMSEARDADLLDAAADVAATLGVAPPRAGKLVAGFILGPIRKVENDPENHRGNFGTYEGPPRIAPMHLGAIAALRDAGSIANAGVEPLIAKLSCAEPSADAHAAKAQAQAAAKELGILIVRDDAAMNTWIAEVLAQNEKIVAEIRGGKQQAIGRLVGEVMKKAGGSADAKAVREAIIAAIG
jgi:aspartyl-tRNA(Asn)/glutamyl-tRNA(Gln) amidotransferase subunit B